MLAVGLSESGTWRGDRSSRQDHEARVEDGDGLAEEALEVVTLSEALAGEGGLVDGGAGGVADSVEAHGGSLGGGTVC